MSAPTDKNQALYQAAVEATKVETEPGLDPFRSQKTWRRIEEELKVPERSTWWQPALATGLAVVAALIVWSQSSPEPIAPPEHQGPARVIYRGGAVAFSGTEGPLSPEALQVELGVSMDLGDRARVDLELEEARVAVVGPAKIRRTRRSVRVESGAAAFSVAPQPVDDPFVVETGDAQVIVHGTVFQVSAQDGRLSSVIVEEGRVEVRTQDGQVRFLEGGQRWPEGGTEPANFATNFDVPWWGGSRRVATGPAGHLLVQSDRPGAKVTLGGAAIGETPLLLRWPAGDHAVRLELAGYAAFDSTVKIEPGTLARLSAKLTPLTEIAETEEVAPKTPAAPRGDPWSLARAQLDKGACRKLERTAGKIIERTADNPERARAEMLLAECWLRRGDKAAALERYRKVVGRYSDTPSHEPASFEVAKLLAERGKKPDALEEIDRHLVRYPHGRFAEPAGMRRCELLLELRRAGPARACLEAHRASYPKGLRISQATLLLATIARSERRFADAAPLYREYLASSPDPSHAERAHYQLLECLHFGKLPGLAVAASDYLARYPDSMNAEQARQWSTP